MQIEGKCSNRCPSFIRYENPVIAEQLLKGGVFACDRCKGFIKYYLIEEPKVLYLVFKQVELKEGGRSVYFHEELKYIGLTKEDAVKYRNENCNFNSSLREWSIK